MHIPQKTNTQLNFKWFDLTVFMRRVRSRVYFSLMNMCGIISMYALLYIDAEHVILDSGLLAEGNICVSS